MNAAETASAFNTVFGPASTEVQGFVDTLNQDFGIPTAELQDAARQFGVFGKAAKVPIDELASFSTSLTQAGLDLGSFYNAAPEDVFASLQGGLSGETEGLRKFGIFMSAASLDAFALEQGLEKTTAQMTEGEKVALRQKFILANLGDAQGDLSRTSDGLANQWRAFTGRLKEAGTAIGSAMLPQANKLVTALNKRLGPIVEELTKTAPLLGAAFMNVFRGGEATEDAGTLLGVMEKLGGVAIIVRDLWEKLSGAFKDSGILGVTQELDGMLGTGDLLTGTVEALQSIFESLGTIWTDLVVPVLTEFNELVPEGIRPIELLATGLGWVAENGEILQPVLAALLAGFIAFKVVTGIIRAVTAAQALLNVVMTANPIGLIIVAIAGLAAGLIYAYKNSETFRRIVDGAFKAVKNIAMTVYKWVEKNWPKLFVIIGGPFGLAAVAIIKNFDTVKAVVMGVFNWVVDNWKLLLAILVGPVGLAVLAIVTHFETIKSTVTGVYDWIVEKFDMAVGFLEGIPGRATDALSGMWDGLRNGFIDTLNWIIRKWNGLGFDIPEFNIPGIGTIGGGRLEVTQVDEISKLHSGGTTTSAGLVNMLPGEEIVFLPEAASVVPMTDNVRNMAPPFTGGGSSEPITLQVVLDRKVIAEAVYDHAGDRVARA
jgi:hypothetical protein